MCGISGIIDYHSKLSETGRATLAAMNDSLHHRGPDDEGLFFDTHAALGHKRLAIIDLEGGVQPMQSRDENFVLVYNGEIYNFKEIRAELEGRGRSFRTASDTEVLLQAFEEWGPDCVHRFNGDFAFALWDRKAEQLFLARDRLGVKPLYYAEVGGLFLFGSEVKALLAHPAVDRRLDPYAVIETFASLQPHAPRTLIEGVKSLEAGHRMYVNRSGVRIERYWDLEYREHTDSLEDTIERVYELLADATRLRMVSDVPICGLLSGGLDSSGLCALMSEAASEPIQTFSINFAGNAGTEHKSITHINGDDSAFARLVAEHIGSRHTEKLIDGQAYFDTLPLTSRARDLPGANGGEVGIYRLCQMVKEHATVALSGEGADEVGAGYYMFFSKELLEEKYNPLLINRIDKMGFIFHPWFRLRRRPLAYLRDLYRDYLAKMPRVWDREEDRVFNTLHYMQLKRTLPYLLDRADRLSMASSVELRVPFCDHRLAEYVFNIPPKLKIKEGVEKHILREALRKKLPDAVVDRKKSFFPYPMSSENMERLHRDFLKLTAPWRRHRTKLRRFIHPVLPYFLIFLARKQIVPVLGAHTFCTTALTLDMITREYDLK